MIGFGKTIGSIGFVIGSIGLTISGVNSIAGSFSGLIIGEVAAGSVMFCGYADTVLFGTTAMGIVLVLTLVVGTGRPFLNVHFS